MIRGALAHLALLAVPLCLGGVERPAQVIFLALAGTFGALEARAQRQERVDREPLAVLGGLSLLATFWLGLGLGGPVSGTTALLGAGLMIAGIALRLAAIRALGPWFASTTHAYPGQPRVRSGVYRRLDHPSELGLCAVALGAALLLGSVPAAVMGALVVLPAAALRALRDERALCYHSSR